MILVEEEEIAIDFSFQHRNNKRIREFLIASLNGGNTKSVKGLAR
jgi:hypothetical protein